jgi:plasmid stabilization system protein ParE
MVYRVDVSDLAEREAYEAYESLRQYSEASATRWLTGLFVALSSLEEMPKRCPIIREAEQIGREIRQLLYGKRTGTYRILFEIDESDGRNPVVNIARIWHSARQAVRLEDIEEALG